MMTNGSTDYFGTLANLALSVSVTGYGAWAWLRAERPEQEAFRHPAYLWWWLSWLAWVFAWALLLLAGALGQMSWFRFKTPVLLCDNLNSICLFQVVLILTRGDRFGPKQRRAWFGVFSASLGVGILALYALYPWLGLDFAYQVHGTWALCLGVVAPILVGWAVYLRFSTWLLLAIGFAYGLVQPIIYAAELPGLFRDVQRYKPVVAMTLALLKVAWAVVFMQMLMNCGADGASLIKARPVIRSHPWGRWPKKLVGHAILLGCVYLSFLTAMVVVYASKLEALGIAVSIVVSFVVLMDIVWRFWEHTQSVQAKATGQH